MCLYAILFIITILIAFKTFDGLKSSSKL
ncbi:hypothetical protein [Prevotella sp. oral taxon 313]